MSDLFADAARERRGTLLAIATGLAYGVLTIMLDRFDPSTGNPLNLTEWAHVPWPWSLPFYTFGGIFLEFLLRLQQFLLRSSPGERDGVRGLERTGMK